MEFIAADKNMIEKGIIDVDMDMDINGEDDFQFKMDIEEYKKLNPYYIYKPGTEYGGIITKVKKNENNMTIKGDLWRKLLQQKIIEPGAEDYKTVSGDINDTLQSLLSQFFPDLLFFYVRNADLNNISLTYKFDRYTNLFAGISKMLKRIGYRLELTLQIFQEMFLIKVTPVKLKDLSSETYGSENTLTLPYRLEKFTGGINHLICLGSGELKNRMVVHLYSDRDGHISEEQTITGNEERTEVYDYSNAESRDELIAGGKKRFKERMNYCRCEFNVENIDAYIGDLITLEDSGLGVSAKAEVTRKIIKTTSDNINTRYEVREVR